MPNDGEMKMHVRFARPVGSNDPIYYIGPFGARVSFESQQKRALNIVGSLLGLGLIKPDHKIAVVGAGLAGLMATLALSARGCNVQLFEASEAHLSLQAGAFHRFIHPSVNFWPIHDALRTTRLPFLDWYSESGQTVIKMLTQQWVGSDDGHFRGADPDDIKPLQSFLKKSPAYGHRMKFERLDAGRVVMTAENKAGEFTFDFVLVAMGFGVEENFNDTAQLTYWQHDFLEERARNPGQHILISGTGDGGLIDCLRLIYKDFRQGDFALTVIKKLESGQYASRGTLTKIEKDAPTGNDLAARSTYFEQQYETLLTGLKPDLKRWLGEQLLKTDDGEFPNRIQLISPLPAPYETTSAVINRFLLAFALKRKALEFLPGTSIDRPVDQYILNTPRGPEPVLASTRVIVRHGPKNALAGFIDDPDQEKALKLHQLEADSYTSEGSFPNIDFAPRKSDIPSLEHFPDAFAQSRHSLALNFVFDRFAHFVDLCRDDQGAPRFEVTRSPFFIRAPLEPISGLPNQIFGIPVEPSARSAGMSHSAFGARP